MVVEPHGLLERRLGLRFRLEGAIHFVLLLQNAVDPLGQGVLVAVHHLGHADRQATGLQPVDILVATVLTAPIRMVDGQLARRQVPQRLVQRLEAAHSLQRIADVGADNWCLCYRRLWMAYGIFYLNVYGNCYSNCCSGWFAKQL